MGFICTRFIDLLPILGDYFCFCCEERIQGGGFVFILRKEYGQKCELGKKIAPCAIIYTGAIWYCQNQVIGRLG